MRKRDRSSSASPILSAVLTTETPEEQKSLRNQQILFDILRRTSLAEQKDREIVEWLTDTAEWLQNCECDRLGAGSLAELRFLVIGVLHTMPWWRVVEAVDTRRTSVASRAITRWHEKIQLAFERVCILLIEQSPHAVRGVLEVAMKPFNVRPPVADGARRSIPADSIMRIMNVVATKYPSNVVLDVLEQCMRSLVPKRRWAEPRHHTTCIALFLHLALEPCIPLFPARDCGENGFLTNGIADTLSNTTHPMTVRGSEDSGTDAGASSVSCKCDSRVLHPVVMTAPAISTSDFDFSDTSIGMTSSTSMTHSFATRFTEFTMQNNKMLAYRNELIRFVLQRLLSMELSLQSSENGPSSECFLSSSFSINGSTDGARAFMGPKIKRIAERPADKLFVEILRVCTTLVFYKLAEDLMRQQTAGVCGNAEWWRELLDFHLSFVIKMECPFYLLYLAPSLALLGGEEEAIDIMHKLVSLVTKGYQPVQQNARRISAVRSASVRMAPPTVGPLMIPTAHRVRAALYLYPLFCFLRDRLGNEEGTRKRLQKWLAHELKGSSSFSTSLPSQLIHVIFAQCAAISHLLGADFVEEMNTYAPDSATLRSMWDQYIIPADRVGESDGNDHANLSFGASSINTAPGGDTFADSGTAVNNGFVCRAGKINFEKMELAGLLDPTLMDGCPWDWRRFQR